MTATTETPNPQSAPSRTRRFFAWLKRWLRSWRNIVGLLLILVLFAVVGVYFFEQGREVTIDCLDANERGVNESGALLVAHIDSEIRELDTQLAGVESAREAKEQELEDLREASPSETDATEVTAALAGQIQTLKGEIAALEGDKTRLSADKDDRELAAKRAEAARDSDQPPFDPDPDRYSPPRTSINLQSRDAVAVISIGSDRDPKRTEIVLEQVSTTTSDAADSADSESEAGPDLAQLPTKPTFLVSAGQIQRSNGLEIPDEDIHVWARWVGSVVLLNVCVAPDGLLDAGRYTGDVYLIDPTLNPVRIAVEVTAQSTWINYSFLLLLFSPLAAFVYVWVVSRHTAGVTPWNMDEFKEWAEQNFVICFAIGFAAVWATLQVPFNNPTWGTSVIGAASVIGVGLVASVTAMTAVVGRVRKDEPPNKDNRR